jgi:tRNA pseudouridine13 synthase
MIKRTPSDFQVSEILNADFPAEVPAAPIRFFLCRLTKESLSTPEATARIARELKLKTGAIAYAGLKDKHAKTVQHITVKLEGDAAIPQTLQSGGWELERLREWPRAIASGDIRGNTFHIVARNLTEQACFDMDEAVALLSNSTAGEKELTLVNYFGDQRFGSARHGQGFLAKHLIAGDFEAALKLAIATESRKDRMSEKIFKRTLREYWGRFTEALHKLRPCREKLAVERLAHSSGDFRAAFCALPYLDQQLAVYAYQSHLWNGIARRLIELQCAERGKIIAVDDPFGEMLFPEAAAVPEALADLQLPLLARRTELAAPWKDAAEEILKEEGIAVTQLQIPGVRRPFFGEEPRTLFFKAQRFEMGKPERDETADDKKRRKRRLSFQLPRGSYATVVLRAIGE